MTLTAAATTEFTNKTYVVTGGFSGIGLAIVQKLLSHGATVHALDLAKDVPEIKDRSAYEESKQFFAYPGVDVSSRAEVTKVFQDEILSRAPVLDGIVNSAGIAPLPTGENTPIETDERFLRVLNVNLNGTWNTATEYLRHFLQREGNGTGTTSGTAIEGVSSSLSASKVPEGVGNVVNIASTASMHAYPGMAAYCASKHAVLGLTRSWAKSFGPRGVRVNCVAPGGTDTAISGAIDDDMQAAYTSMVPLGRLARPDEVADAVLFLLGPRSSFINGQMVPVEGGMSSF